MAWEAGQVLTTISASSRTIYTWAGGAMQAFPTANSALTQGRVGAASSTERQQINEFLRGLGVHDEEKNSKTPGRRPRKLGDIFHSTPVLVTAPVRGLADPSYQAFKTSQASRVQVVITGANDGMLHAFRESDGRELWAFIPPDLLSGLKDLLPTSGDHNF